MRICRRCKEKEAPTYHTWCRSCKNAYAKESKVVQRWYQIKYKYGLSQSDYWKLYNEQHGKCAICGVVKKYLVIDHNHQTNKIRGLLCSTCNRAIGMVGDSIDNLINAIEYLKK